MQTVRVFISSTFTDFSLERNILHSSVFPRIRKLCARQGCEFQAVDLRWGITERDSRDYSTLDICLEEIRQCQRVTPRPNFIFLSGSKYGWRPLPRRISAGLFRTLEEALRGSEKKALLNKVYRQDENSAEGDYVFCGLPSGTDEAAVRGILREAADAPAQGGFRLFRRKKAVSEEERTRLFASATHLELLERLSLPDFSGSAICAVRTLKNVPEERKDLYYDTLPDRSVDADSCGDARKTGRTAEELCPDTYHYELDLADPDKALEGFADHVYRKMEMHILNELKKGEGAELADEVRYHREYMADHLRFFRGRTAVLDKAGTLILSGKCGLILVRGASGCGKSAFMARLASLAEQGGRRLLYRSVGLTGDSADIRKLSEDLAQEAAGDGASGPEERVIFLDDAEKARNPRAFLRAALKLCGGASCVVLSLSDAFARQAEDLLPGKAETVHLETLPESDIEEILSAHLDGNGRRLTEAQRNSIVKAFRIAPNMHVFHALCLQALKWRSFDPAPSPEEAVRGLLGSIERGSANLPPELAGRLRLYLAAAREGLTGTELLGALSRDRRVLEEFLRLSEHLLPGAERVIAEHMEKSGAQPGDDRDILRWIRTAPDLSGLLDALLASGRELLLPYAYFSRALYDFMPALGERLSQGQRVYVIEEGLSALAGKRDGEALKEYHSLLADYFASSEDAGLKGRLLRMLQADTGTAGSSRLAVELPYQYLKADRCDDLYAFLCDPEWLVFLDRWDRPELASLWNALKARGEYDMAKGYEPLLRQAEALAGGGGEIGTLTRQSLEALIALLGSWGGYPREIEYLNSALLLITKDGDPDLYLQSRAQKAMTMMDAGLFSQALEYTEQLMREVPETVSAGYCDLLYAYGVALFRVERYPEAGGIIARGYEVARKLGEKNRIRNLLKWRASCEKVMGNAQEADRIYRELEEQYEQDEDKHSLIATYYERASSVFLFEADPEKALGLLETSARYARETGQRSWLLQIYNLEMNMRSTIRDYEGLKTCSLRFLETWAEVNPGRKPRDPEIINFLIALTKTEPSAENLFLAESCMLLLACGPVRAEDACIRAHSCGNALMHLYRTCLSYMPEGLRRIVSSLPPAPEIFAEAFDKGVEKYCESFDDKRRESFSHFLSVFDAIAGKSLRGEALGQFEDNGSTLSEKQTLEMRTTMGIFLLYTGFDPIPRVRESAGAQQAQFMTQVHMLLFQANYAGFKNTMSYNEYSRRMRRHNTESQLFEHYREEAHAALSEESELVRSLVEKFSKR
ncbi:MAG: DUF4062 domain-containing protein [Clostridia bacterium]|nr:DUF4062 domain-containing protein [Clostridia bacterium]